MSMRGQRGYVLILVLGAVALLALVATRFATRIDELRQLTSALADQARGRVAAADALAVALYQVSTLRTGPAGFGPALAPTVLADDRPYQVPGGGHFAVQDMRGLYPLNAVDRPSLTRLLGSVGVMQSDTDSLIDVLLDYADTDDLKRLNGAERADYATLGLPAPRNDWLVSVRELQRMPLWRDRPTLIDKLDPLASTSRMGFFNPNTAPRPVLQAFVGDARPEQLELFDTLRRRTPFTDGLTAQRVAGLRLDSDVYLFFVGDQFRLTVWAAGLPQALQYNVLLIPGGFTAPWLISEVHLATRPVPSPAPYRATSISLALPPDQP